MSEEELGRGPEVVVVPKESHEAPKLVLDPGLTQKGILYSWDNINVYTGSTNKRCCKKGGESSKHILQNVSGLVRSGQLLALIGSSGAGKTTLLNVLHFNSGKLLVTGDRCINGNVVNANVISRLSAYVQQEDLFIPTLTVHEHLIFTARVRMDSKLSFKERSRRVDQVIHDLGLSKCKNSKIGDPAVQKGISGGEMKRLAFAAEFLTDPEILFCDEPTTGLDSFMAQSVVEVMLKMAKLGKAIICTIHQPASEVFEMFDHICLLSAGRVGFSGTTNEALDFFTECGYKIPPNHNPADFFIFTLAIIPGEEEACRAKTQAICDAFDKSEQAAEIEEIVKYRSPTDSLGEYGKISHGICPYYRANWFVQFDALLRRSLISFTREPLLFLARIIQTILMSLIVGFIFYQQPLNQAGTKNISACLFIIILNMTVMNCFGVIFIFTAELPVFLREHWNGMYRVDAYFLAKTTAELPFITAYALIFNAICYYMIGLNPGVKQFFLCALVCIMVAHCSTSYGYLMSTVCKNLMVALAITPPTLVPIMIFCGYFLRDDETPDFWSWVKYFSWYYYALEALFQNQWWGYEGIENETPHDMYLSDGEQILDFYGYKEGNQVEDILALFALVIGYRVIAFLGLLWKTGGRGQ